MSVVEQQIRYCQTSSCDIAENKGSIKLVAAQQTLTNPIHFDGELLAPEKTAKCLRALSNVVRSRFYVPPAMLERIILESDPVVTASRTKLRFEGFSSCCSCYARLDINPDGFKATRLSPGTTNVDFRDQMRGALASVRNDAQVRLSVTQEGLELQHDENTVLERKVKLPLRWVKGFSEVQAQQAGAKKVFEVTRGEAFRFFRQLPRMKTREDVWVFVAGSSLRQAHRPRQNAVKLKGLERLRLLEDLAPFCDRLSVYADDSSSLSCWVLTLGPLYFSLVMSSEPWRGFSGEGNLLKQLSAKQRESVLAKVKSALNWQDELEPETLAQQLQEPTQDVIAALTVLAARGLVGYDVVAGRFFHRILPFNSDIVDRLNPRLKAAKKLIADNAVTLISLHPQIQSEVRSRDVTHRVVIDESNERCTCPWYAKYRGDRGPCKHVLATHLHLEERENEC